MATALTDSARRLDLELRRCETAVAEVKASILARAEPNVVRWQFRQAQSAMMCLGRELSLDNRFRPRLPSHVRNEALDMLRAGARPIELQKKLGLDNLTIRRLRRRELRDFRDLNHMCKLTAEQIAEIKSNRTVKRSYFARKFGVSTRVISRVRCGLRPYGETSVLSPVQQKRRPGPAAAHSLTLRLNAPLLETLAQMSALAHSEVGDYAGELIETAAADFRAKKIPSTFMDLDATMPLTAPATTDVKPRGRLSPDDKNKIIMQRAEGTGIRELATRWHCGASSIRRALQGAKKRRTLTGASPETIQRILFLSAKKYDGDQFISIDEIAEAVGQPEAIVRAVLARHKPLTPSAVHAGRPGGWDKNLIRAQAGAS